MHVCLKALLSGVAAPLAAEATQYTLPPVDVFRASRSGADGSAFSSSEGTSDIDQQADAEQSFTKAWVDGSLQGVVEDIYKVEALQNQGSPCLEQCGGTGGLCASYCGLGNACCKKVSESFWHNMDPPECGRVTQDTFLTDEHECVALPSVMTGDCNVVHSRTTSTQRYFSAIHRATRKARRSRELRDDFKFYMYDLPPALNTDLLKCYEKETNTSVWIDERKERAQNTAEIWVHKVLESHPRRTRDPSEASIFYVPFYGALSAHFSGVPEHNLKPCNGQGHLERVDMLLAHLKDSSLFESPEQQAKHAMTVSYWGVTTRSYPHWEEWLDTSYAVLTGPLRDAFHKVRVLIYEPHFGGFGDPEEFKYWDGPVTTIPYVADHHLANAKFSLPAQRLFSVYFRGNMELDSSNKTSGVASDGQVTRCSAFQSARDIPGSRLIDSSTNFSYQAYVDEMLNSTFCLVPRGDTPTSRRLFDAIAAGCVPVLVGDDLSVPFDDILDWDAFSIRIREENSAHVKIRLMSITARKLAEMQTELLKVRDDFIYGWGNPLNGNWGRVVDNILVTIA